MSKPQFAILRFAKYKGPEISNIEAHNERTKDEYASNPDIDKSRSCLNFHLLEPERKYRAEAERQIKDAGCRTRSDSVRVVEALVTATPEFFKGKKKDEIKAYFREALDFIREHQDQKTIISAVVHMDEKTPHMHLSFVPLTEDGRLCAKEIVGNKKKLTQWQDRFWEHMVKKYPDLGARRERQRNRTRPYPTTGVQADGSFDKTGGAAGYAAFRCEAQQLQGAHGAGHGVSGQVYSGCCCNGDTDEEVS